ncbi:MAG: hypothetical protein ACOCXZ_00945 [Chloroflexota bacterium]
MTRHTDDSGRRTAAHKAARRQALNRLLRDIVMFAVAPVLVLWLIWLAGDGSTFPWPMIPTLIAVAWAASVLTRFNLVFREAPPLVQQSEDPAPPQRVEAKPEPKTASVTEVPRIRFTEDGDPTDSFIRELHRSKSGQDAESKKDE